MNIVGVERENKGNPLSKHKFILNLLHWRIKTILAPSNGLIHDLGKVLLHPSFGELLNDLLLYFMENPDYNNPSYNTMEYTPKAVAKEKQTTLPSAGLFIIRYHSFYTLHKSEAYEHLVNDEDRENMKWLKVFNIYDLYSKSKVRINVEEVEPYYISLINKYFPTKLKW
ncbi:hypothetical protein HID58_081184 [Brassica napus]|uniref:Inositol oxygenase n=2 Tax=Brassica TaxID=3705 RepID=A0ABQ7Y704_BRANA|nr:hypothetical protein HID58_081184 [Brassica napus]